MIETTSSPDAGTDSSPELDRRLRQILNDASLALMISVGHRVGLFDAMAELPPSTAEEIAEAADLDLRYVTEWLRAMTVGELVRYDADSERFSLPPEVADRLSRRAGPENAATRLQFIPILAGVEDQIVECFHTGEGVPYEAYSRFHEAQHEGAAAEMDAYLVDRYLPLVPGLVEELERSIDILDLGCGAGRAANVMAEAFPESRVAGYDIAEEALAIAREEARERDLDNVRFAVRDAARLDEEERWDLVTAFDVIHDQAAPSAVVKNVHRALRPGGVFFMVEKRGSSHLENNVDHPIGPYLYAVSCMHCMSVSLAGGGPGLGTLWGREQARELLRESGFDEISVKGLPDDETTDFWVARKA